MKKVAVNEKKKSKELGTIVLCAGGSGGHIFPAEALATKLLEQGLKVVLLTDKRGKAFEANDKIQVVRVNGEAFTGRSIFGKVFALLLLGLGTIQSFFVLRRLKPLAVVGFGGFASIPGGMGAYLARIPLIIHEQNAVLGRANRLLAKKARLVITSFKKTSKVPRGIKTSYVGMPVRQQIAKKAGAPYPKLGTKGKINILVIGGSQGARILSDVVPAAIGLLPKDIQKKLEICQQCRKEDLERVKKAYKGTEAKVTLANFFDDIPDKMAKAHLIISRSGASSMAEIFAIGRPAILVPFKYAADDHQSANALALKEKGGGWLMNENGFTPAALAERLESLFENTDVLKNAASCALIKDTPKIADSLVKTVLDVARERKEK